MVAELGHWRGVLTLPSLRLVEGALDGSRDVLGTAGHLRLTLPGSVTGALLTRVAAAFHCGINDVLLTRACACGCAVEPDAAGAGRRRAKRYCWTLRVMAARMCLPMST